MEFKSLKDTESSFRQIRLFGIVFLSPCTVITVWSVWSSYRFVERQREEIYVPDNGKPLILALSQELSQNRPVETREHMHRFHESLLMLSSEKSAIEHNVKYALPLANKSVYNYHSDFTEKGYYDCVIAGNINQVLKMDSMVYDLNGYPYRAVTHVAQRTIRRSNATERSLVTTCRFLNSSCLGDNLNGLTIKRFTIIRNKDLQTVKRQADMKEIGRSLWSTYWRPHDKKKILVARLKGYLDGLPPRAHVHTVLVMLAAFVAFALYAFGKVVYDIGRNDDNQIVTDHARQVELSVKPDNNHNVTPYLYKIDEE